MANVLERIVADKEIELEQRKIAFPLSEFKDKVRPTKRDFTGALAQQGTQFILECKKASPSKGLIRAHFDLDEITSVYSRYATCISVLTDEKYFQGSYQYLEYVRSKVSQPLICKDFFIDEYQIYLARFYGGDAVLLMLSVLDDAQYTALAHVAKSLNMSILTEVSNEEETARAQALGADLIGINNRNLRDLSTCLETTERLRPLITNGAVVISESGIYTHQDVKRLSPIVDGFLVGSSLMAQQSLDSACRQLILGENKVCGLTRTQDALNAYNAGAVFGGLIFYSKSPRYVNLDCAREVVDSAPLKYVGVFVNSSLEEVAEYANTLKLAAVQLHGDEDADYITLLRNLLPVNCQIWKALGVSDVQPDLFELVDRHIFDTKANGQSGGTGKQFNWELIKDLKTPFILAGGLSAANIPDAHKVGALGFDLNSGVELTPGKKCVDKINDAFSQIRNY